MTSVKYPGMTSNARLIDERNTGGRQAAETALPVFATARLIRQRLAPVPARRLRDWVRQGLVRCAKCGTARQSPALFRVADVAAVLDAFAAGRQPAMRPTTGGRR